MASPSKDEFNESNHRINSKFGHKLAPIIPAKFSPSIVKKDNDLKFLAEEVQSSETSKMQPQPVRTMPIYVVSKLKHSLALNPSRKDKESNEGKREEMLARGRLVGTFSEEVGIEGEIDFVGNFEGVFERSWDEIDEHYVYYFEGSIKNLKIGASQSYPTPLNFSGFFKGLFLPAQPTEVDRAL